MQVLHFLARLNRQLYFFSEKYRPFSRYQQYQQQMMVITQRWEQQHRTIHFSPTLALHYGSELHDLIVEQSPETGVIGVVDRQLCFVKFSDLTERLIDLDSIRWVGLSQLQMGRRHKPINNVLIVHYEHQKRWNMAAFSISDDSARTALIKTLTDLTQRTPPPDQVGWDNFGPYPAQRMAQDVYGQWHPAYSSGAEITTPPGKTGLHGQLQWVLGLLIYNGVIVLDLAQVRRVDLYQHESAGVFGLLSKSLLRIEYEEEGRHQVAGFLVESGHRWINWLKQSLSVPVEVHEGRKKKGG